MTSSCYSSSLKLGGIIIGIFHVIISLIINERDKYINMQENNEEYDGESRKYSVISHFVGTVVTVFIMFQASNYHIYTHDDPSRSLDITSR